MTDKELLSEYIKEYAEKLLMTGFKEYKEQLKKDKILEPYYTMIPNIPQKPVKKLVRKKSDKNE